MDTIELVLLALLVGAVLLDQLYRFRVLRVPPPVDDDEPRRFKPHKGKRHHRNGGGAPYEASDRPAPPRDERKPPGQGNRNGSNGRGFERPFP